MSLSRRHLTGALVTNRPEEFDFDATLRALGDTAPQASAEAQAAIELAAYALLFLHAENRLTAFREYLRDVKSPALLSVRIEREFTDMPQASQWLHAAPPPAHGTLVKVAGRTYAVWRDEDESLLLPSLSPEELEARKK